MHLFSASHLLCIPAVSVSHKSILFAFEHNEIKVGALFETVVTECTENLNTLFEGTSVIGLILRSLWGLYKMHETLWFYLVTL